MVFATKCMLYMHSFSSYFQFGMHKMDIHLLSIVVNLICELNSFLFRFREFLICLILVGLYQYIKMGKLDCWQIAELKNWITTI